jgi:hypothetical protein
MQKHLHSIASSIRFASSEMPREWGNMSLYKFAQVKGDLAPFQWTMKLSKRLVAHTAQG